MRSENLAYDVVGLYNEASFDLQGGSGSGAEICPVCNASFRNLNDLIAHSTATHQGGYSPTEVCPHCQALFVDAVQLVEHVERHHSRGTACVLS